MSRVFVGADVGALSAKVVKMDHKGHVFQSAYRFHKGKPQSVLQDLFKELELDPCVPVALTGSGTKSFPKSEDVLVVDGVRAAIAATSSRNKSIRNIVDIGGCSQTLIRLDAHGRFCSFTSNSRCASGTGSFLDEQAMRLGLTHEAMQDLEIVHNPPKVATRCAVFAKSDLIHLQQAGSTLNELWSGLCRGMAQTVLNTLLKGKPLGGSTALIGGVSQNRSVVQWFKQLADSEIQVDPAAHWASALGAALVLQQQQDATKAVHWQQWLQKNGKSACARNSTIVCRSCDALSDTPKSTSGAERVIEKNQDQPLELKRTNYPSFEVAQSFEDDDANEIRITHWPVGEDVTGTLGIDIGSTSTKLCLIDQAGNVCVDIYRKTSGNPISATQKLFKALESLAKSQKSAIHMIGCGTTGSGRKLIGAVLGADRVVNEISAHVAGAMHIDPSIKTIFEIGGQDSKFMRTHNGAIVEANMNYVCAAGTGSFVEEQARRLGVPLVEVGERVLGCVPPNTSDRCTVFMEQDVNQLVADGLDVSSVLAGVMRSVVQNYLNRVVGNRKTSDKKIAFQGATARNKGLVAAFETLLDVEMVVSPYCHVMGAWGVALITQEALKQQSQPSTFVGLDFSKRQIQLRHEPCALCQNECDITYAVLEGLEHEPSWGYLCGRDPEDTKVRVCHEYKMFQKRKVWLSQKSIAPLPTQKSAQQARPVVGIPRSLAFYSHLPMWRTLLEQLGAKVVLQKHTDTDVRDQSARLVSAEFCYPVKLAHGHVAQALQNKTLDWVFVPHMVAQETVGQQCRSYYCPYVQGFPAVVRAALNQANIDTSRMLVCEIDQQLELRRQIRKIYEALGPVLGANESEVAKAWDQACRAQQMFSDQCEQAGTNWIESLATSGNAQGDAKPGIVLLGRPYNLNDSGINLDLPKKIADMGFRVLPVDFLPYDPDSIDPRFHNVCWAYGQRLLSALKYVKEHDNLHAVYFTNFNCGPDSFLLSFAEEIMGNKPMLMLELDEHGADAGYMTRVEAFLDVLKGEKTKSVSSKPMRISDSEGVETLHARKIFVPHLHPIGAKLFAAAFRAHGLDAEALPLETHQELELGQRYTRGCECLPARTTIGNFLHAAKNSGLAPEQIAFFMPTSPGPCRFGQYAGLDRMILDRAGFDKTVILSPTTHNGYHGLNEKVRRTLWKSILAADALFGMGARIRPYEKEKGQTNALLAKWIDRTCTAFETHGAALDTIRQAAQAFAAIKTTKNLKPLVGIVGEIYVRHNAFCNQQVVKAIERSGAEAWMTPFSEWLLYIAHQDAWLVPYGRTLGKNLERAKKILTWQWMSKDAAAFHRACGSVLKDRPEPVIKDTRAAAERYLPFNIGGEAILTIGRCVEFVHQGANLVVNASPFGCMAGTTCASIFTQIEKDLGTPIVSLFYDGTGDENARLEVFVANLDPSMANSRAPKTYPTRKRARFDQLSDTSVQH